MKVQSQSCRVAKSTKTLQLKLQLIANNCLLPKLPQPPFSPTTPSATHRLFQLICANSIVSAARRRRRRQNKAHCRMQKSAQLCLIAHISVEGEEGGGHKTTNGLKAH